MGLREIKKAKTRKLISDIARDLFIEKGYDTVTIAEIAEKAEVAVTTLFNYFPTKESLIFDLEDEIDTDILKAIKERKKGQSILDALYRYFFRASYSIRPIKKLSPDLESSSDLRLNLLPIYAGYGPVMKIL